jgi:hypothetical protein
MQVLRVLKSTPGKLVNGRFVANPKGRKKNSSSTSSDVRSPTSTKTEVRSPTETSTSTSTDAYTAGNITITGGAGKGAYTQVDVHQRKIPESEKGSQRPQRAPWDGVPKVHAATNPKGKLKVHSVNKNKDGTITLILTESKQKSARRRNPGFTGIKEVTGKRRPFEVWIGGYRRASFPTRRGAEGYLERWQSAQ